MTWTRWAPWTGVAFVVFFVGGVMASSPPSETASNAAWIADYATHGKQVGHVISGVVPGGGGAGADDLPDPAVVEGCGRTAQPDQSAPGRRCGCHYHLHVHRRAADGVRLRPLPERGAATAAVLDAIRQRRRVRVRRRPGDGCGGDRARLPGRPGVSQQECSAAGSAGSPTWSQRCCWGRSCSSRSRADDLDAGRHVHPGAQAVRGSGGQSSSDGLVHLSHTPRPHRSRRGACARPAWWQACVRAPSSAGSM